MKIWHWLVAVAASGLIFAMARMVTDVSLHASLISLVLGLCFFLGLVGAWQRGRPTLDALVYVLLLGPFGVVFAWSEYPLARNDDPRRQRAW
jgi:hypothetical protein